MRPRGIMLLRFITAPAGVTWTVHLYSTDKIYLKVPRVHRVHSVHRVHGVTPALFQLRVYPNATVVFRRKSTVSTESTESTGVTPALFSCAYTPTRRWFSVASPPCPTCPQVAPVSKVQATLDKLACRASTIHHGETGRLHSGEQSTSYPSGALLATYPSRRCLELAGSQRPYWRLGAGSIRRIGSLAY
jgi:hypothetical protein